MPKPKKDLKATIEDELASMLEDKGEPSEGRMKLLKLGVGYLAVQAKLEENEYGNWFNDDGGDSAVSTIEKGAKSSASQRKARAGAFADTPNLDPTDRSAH